MDRAESEYCVVGAGYAGLSAAWRIHQKGRSVTVLEARDRVGGRTWTEEHSGIPIDYGGQWLGSGQDRAYALAKEFGIETYPTWTEGENVFVISGKVRRYRGEIPKADVIALLDLGLALRQFAKWSGEVPLEAPWTAKRAKEWDAMTVATWIRDVAGTETARKMLRALMGGVYTSDPGEVSLLFALFQAKSCGGINALISSGHGMQNDRIRGGTQGIPIRIASKLGENVQLNAPVRRISQDSRGVVVDSEKLSVKAKRVIVAVPPTLSGQILFDPVLPVDRAMLLQRLPAGSAIKAAAIYREPFWREDGMSGQSVDLDALVEATLDGSPPSGCGVLNAFAFGQKARELARLTPEDRKSVFLKQLAKIFGPKAATPLEFVDHNWAEEPWTRGCYMAHWPPGVITAYSSALWDPVGRIHWAGTETSIAFNGAIEGAIRSGERAASEAIGSKD